MRLAVLGCVTLTACTTLGPMPATTLVSPVPAGSPDVEVGVGAAPGYYLSSGATKDPRGAGIPQLSALFEPDRLLGVPGLFAALRVVGTDDAGSFGEPMLGYRRSIGDRLALGLVGYGTHSSKTNRDAHYDATRLGVEVASDVRLTPQSRWVEVHVLAGAAVTGLIADGDYCLDAEGRYGVDCPQPPDPPASMASASASGIYPSVHAGAVVAFGQHLMGVFHGARLTLHAAGGTMPTVVSGVQEEAGTYGSLGLSFSVGVGAARSGSDSR